MPFKNLLHFRPATGSFKPLLMALILCFLSYLKTPILCVGQSDTLTYVSIVDSCQIFQFLPDGKVFIPGGCGIDIDFMSSFIVQGRHIEGRSVFDMKAKPSKCLQRADEVQYEVYHENMDILNRVVTIINRDSFLILSHLKTLPGIECHYQGIMVYERSDKKGCFKKEIPVNPLKIYLGDLRHGDHIYLAMDQSIQNSDGDLPTNQVLISNGSPAKTAIKFDPVDIVNEHYEFYIMGKEEEGFLQTKKIPSFRRLFPSIYMPLEDRQRAVENHISEIGNSEYFLCYSWNPGRTRVVNERFGEDIDGNVLSIIIYSLEEYLKE